MLHRDHGSDLSERGVSAVPHSACGTSGLGNGVPHIALLAVRNIPSEINKFAELGGLTAEDEQLKDTNKNEATRENGEPPIGRRFIVALLLVAAGTYLSLRG